MTETIYAMRVWHNPHSWQVIGHRDNGRIFKATTTNAWMASLWDQACRPARRALTVEWHQAKYGPSLTSVAFAQPKESHV